MRVPFLPLFILYGFLYCGCMEKDEVAPPDQLPAYSQMGANTIGCLVNGRVFIPRKHDLYGSSFEYYQNKLTIYIDREGERVYIGIWDKSVTDTGHYDLTYIYTKKNVFYMHADGGQYRTNDMHTGKLYIRHWDKQKHIMSGTFYFDAIRGDSSIVHITNGRFDMIYN